MSCAKEHSKTKFKRLLEKVVTLNRVDGDNIDMLVASNRELLHEVAGCELQSKFKDFTVESDRLDVLLYECMGHNKTYEKLWSVIRKVLQCYYFPKVRLLLSEVSLSTDR